MKGGFLKIPVQGEGVDMPSRLLKKFGMDRPAKRLEATERRPAQVRIDGKILPCATTWSKGDTLFEWFFLVEGRVYEVTTRCWRGEESFFAWAKDGEVFRGETPP